MGTIGAIAEVVALSLEILKDHIDDPKRRAKAVASYIQSLRDLREKLGDEQDIKEIDDILVSIIIAKP